MVDAALRKTGGDETPSISYFEKNQSINFWSINLHTESVESFGLYWLNALVRFRLELRREADVRKPSSLSFNLKLATKYNKIRSIKI